MLIAVIADIHGNIPALDAVLADLDRRGGADLLVNLGDCVSGPLWPRETMERLEGLGLPTVRGNHDRRVASEELASTQASDRFAYERLVPRQRDWLGSLPLTLEIAPSVLAFHARPDHDEKYLTEVIDDGRLLRAPLAVIEKRLKPFSAGPRLLLCGHSHRPELLRLDDGRLIFNPGSVGCPAYFDPTEPAHASETGTPHARYGMVEIGAGGALPRVETFAVPYDNEAAARRADESGRPEWAHALRTGFIPIRHRALV
jgi:diadenosine tetraphosphatase ApaH/serine/threonine PP2A family protein phosphatase